ncbi:CCC motif membrane protein [Cellulophaga sp. L1A9]|uniref:CCC motif membrane protein n=1 Tax=Cellulophaga sp. L1A9 TaxID=2686362 RepID=UPI00131CE98D|nr:CCC motif membrane protein [Cellulophaga sp. L1A9]
MEQQKLPNATMIIVLSIFGYLCCCFAGLGIIPSGIAFFMATKAEKLNNENPEIYDNYSTIKTGKIVAMIAVILNILMVIRYIYLFATGGFSEMQVQWDEMMRQIEEAQ